MIENCPVLAMWRRFDSNKRPPGYEPGELPTAPLRDVLLISSAKVLLIFGLAKLSGFKMALSPRLFHLRYPPTFKDVVIL